MMRISGGILKGREIMQPSVEITRPIAGRAKEAAFNILGDISDLTVLDLYAGSGILGIEAISRGATSVTAVENSKEVASILHNNYAQLGIEDRLYLHIQPVALWAMHNRHTFDIVFADPPFPEFEEETVQQIAAKTQRVFVLKHDTKQNLPDIKNMKLERHRKYGKSMLAIFVPDK